MTRAVEFPSKIGRRIVVVALLTIALVSAGIYGFVSKGSGCPGAAPTAGLGSGLITRR